MAIIEVKNEMSGRRIEAGVEEQGVRDELPKGYCAIRVGKARIVTKKEYAGSFLAFTMPARVKPQPGGRRSGRAFLTPMPLSNDGAMHGLVRRYIRGGFAGRFLKENYLNVGRPRPLKELGISEVALAHGVPTPEVAAAVVERVNPLIYRGALITREIAPAADLQEEALAFSPCDRDAIKGKRRCIDSLGRLIARMHGAGIYHADLHLKNVLKSGEKLYLLDLDAARIRHPLPEYRKRMNLLRLYRSAQKINGRRRVITRTDMLRFVRSYSRESSRSAESFLPQLFRMLPLWRLKWRLSDLLNV